MTLLAWGRAGGRGMNWCRFGGGTPDLCAQSAAASRCCGYHSARAVNPNRYRVPRLAEHRISPGDLARRDPRCSKTHRLRNWEAAVDDKRLFVRDPGAGIDPNGDSRRRLADRRLPDVHKASDDQRSAARRRRGHGRGSAPQRSEPSGEGVGVYEDFALGAVDRADGKQGTILSGAKQVTRCSRRTRSVRDRIARPPRRSTRSRRVREHPICGPT
jgi:hypothetical protein